MSSKAVEHKGRRNFFLAMAAGIGDAVSGAASLVGALPEAPPAEPPAPTPSAPQPQLRRRNAPPTSIPDVRSE